MIVEERVRELPLFGSAAILAGGAGSRFGGVDKDSIQGPEGPLGPALARRLLPRFEELLVLSRRPELYDGLPVATTADRIPGFGPLSGLHAALGASKSEWLYLTACDMPNFSREFAGFLRSRIMASVAAGAAKNDAHGEGPSAALTRFGRHFEPFHAFYSKRLIPVLEALFERARGRTAVEGRRPSFRDLFDGLDILYIPEVETRRFSPDWTLFLNINTPEDLARFREGE